MRRASIGQGMGREQRAGWTEERTRVLRTLWAAGASAGQIGKAMGLTNSAVLGKAHRLGLEGRASPIQHRVANTARQNPTKPDITPETPDVYVRTASTVPHTLVASAKAQAKKAPFWLPTPIPPAKICQWPEGDRPYRFCEAPAEAGRSYCGEHCKRAYLGRHRATGQGMHW